MRKQSLRNKQLLEESKKKRLGQEKINFQGSIMKIIEYNNSKDILVEFQDEHKFCIRTNCSNFDAQTIKNPFVPTMKNIGYLGCLKVTNKLAYRYWAGMFDRCYDKENGINKYPSYKECTIDKEWHNYYNFERWFNENYYKISNEVMCLDKDILVKGNKVYSSKTCIFVPARINMLFEKCDKSRGKYPIGVSKRDETKYKNSYRAKYRDIDGKRRTTKTFNNPLDCFYEYKKEKERVIKKAADLYKDKIPTKLYDAMYNYIVEEND